MKEESKAKYFKCPFCKTSGFGYVGKCFRCDTPTEEITKEEFLKLIEKSKKS